MVKELLLWKSGIGFVKNKTADFKIEGFSYLYVGEFFYKAFFHDK